MIKTGFIIGMIYEIRPTHIKIRLSATGGSVVVLTAEKWKEADEETFNQAVMNDLEVRVRVRKVKGDNWFMYVTDHKNKAVKTMGENELDEAKCAAVVNGRQCKRDPKADGYCVMHLRSLQDE